MISSGWRFGIILFLFLVSMVSSQGNLCSTVPSTYMQTGQYCRNLCMQVCEITLCTDSALQQSFVDSCYEDCACMTQGLSLGGTHCSGGAPEPGLVFCYTAVGCPPSDGQYFTQADLNSYDANFGTGPNVCPNGATTMLTGNNTGSVPPSRMIHWHI